MRFIMVPTRSNPRLSSAFGCSRRARDCPLVAKGSTIVFDIAFPFVAHLRAPTRGWAVLCAKKPFLIVITMCGSLAACLNPLLQPPLNFCFDPSLTLVTSHWRVNVMDATFYICHLRTAQHSTAQHIPHKSSVNGDYAITFTHSWKHVQIIRIPQVQENDTPFLCLHGIQCH